MGSPTLLPSPPTLVSGPTYTIDVNALFGIMFNSVAWATTAALPANTYANGTSGVGATLTANANGALSVDSGSPAVNDRVLVWKEATASHNGIYVVTQAGDGSHPYILTRAADCNQTSVNIFTGLRVHCTGGTALIGTAFLLTTTGVITVGTTSLTFTQISGPASSLNSGTLMLGSLLATNMVTPSTPSSGTTYIYVDSTQKVLSAKNDGGAVSNTVVPGSAPAHQWVTGITAAGALQFAQPSASDLSDGVTGTGAVVRATSPTLTTPTLGVATATTVNKVTLTQPATGSTLTIADGKTLTVNGTMTLNVGQYPGTATNDNATAGDIGETVQSIALGPGFTSTVTITIASPGVVTWTSHGFTTAVPVVFTTTGTLPTGITSGTTYWVVPASITTNTFQVATSLANALAGTAVNTSGTQSGTQTGTCGCAMTSNTSTGLTAISLTAGDWDVWAVSCFIGPSSTTVTYLWGSIGTTVASMDNANPGKFVFSRDAALTIFDQGAAIVRNIAGARFSLSGTTTVYLNVQSIFGVSTETAFGAIFACRRR